MPNHMQAQWVLKSGEHHYIKAIKQQQGQNCNMKQIWWWRWFGFCHFSLQCFSFFCAAGSAVQSVECELKHFVFCLFCLFEKYVCWEGIQSRSHREERNVCWWCLLCSEHLFCLQIPMGWVYIALWSTCMSWTQLVVLCALWCLCGHNVCEERHFL